MKRPRSMRPIPFLIGLFIILPFVELYLLFELARATSAATALAIVIATGILGGILARSQGLAVIRRLRDDLQRGKLPADALFDGALVLVGGVLLLTPGMITDTLGFALLIPPTRKLLKKLLKKKVKALLAGSEPREHYSDVQFEVKDEDRKL